MMSEDRVVKAFEPPSTPRTGESAATVRPSDLRRELTEEELAAVTAGRRSELNPQPLPP
jgi:hypothetical protein